MNMTYDNILNRYVDKIISPDGRHTFETKASLSEELQNFALPADNEILIDLGCGWGASINPFVRNFKKIIGVDISMANIQKAQEIYKNYPHIEFQHKPIQNIDFKDNYADLIVSSLVFHQVSKTDRIETFLKISKVLKPEGKMVLADQLIMFEPHEDNEKFNDVYRYLLKSTTPQGIYEERIKPFIQDDYIYTWEDMLKNTPEEYRYYSIADMQTEIEGLGLQIIKTKEFTPFFGMILIGKKV